MNALTEFSILVICIVFANTTANRLTYWSLSNEGYGNDDDTLRQQLEQNKKLLASLQTQIQQSLEGHQEKMQEMQEQLACHQQEMQEQLAGHQDEMKQQLDAHQREPHDQKDELVKFVNVLLMGRKDNKLDQAIHNISKREIPSDAYPINNAEELLNLLLDSGITGPPGRDGKDGEAGRDGETGRDGDAGRDGDNGKDGEVGRSGEDGRDGENGRDGADGKDAIDGAPGPPGPPGVSGNNGTVGSQGPRGPPGADGEDGENGRDGADGKDGEDGDNGRNAIGQVTAQEVVGSTDHDSFVVGNVIDGDTSGSTAKSFCTIDDEDGRYVYLNLGGRYEISYVKVWGRDGYLSQMENLQITVADTVAGLDDAVSICVYRDGPPAVGKNRPEIFTCSSPMTGQYVRVSMIDFNRWHFLCINEVKVYGIAAMP